jgi:hypothetical protein
VRFAEAAMTDWSVLAAWLRQRSGETDQQWVERLGGLIEEAARDRAEPRVDDPKTLRIMDRAWKRHVAGLEGSAGSAGDDI